MKRLPYSNLQEYLDTRAIPEPNSGCYIWMGAITTSGYPAGNAHRRAYKLTGKTVPIGCELDHTCRVRCCINPDHLEPVTHKQNLLRGANTFAALNKNKVYCIRGHLLSATAYITKNGSRTCRVCVNIKKSSLKEYYSAKKAAWRAKNKARNYATWRAWYDKKKAHSA